MKEEIGNQGGRTQGEESVLIVGAGLMGSQIALQCAEHGFSVCMVDPSESALEEAARNQSQELGERCRRGLMTADQKEEISDRIHSTAHLRQVAGHASFVIETVPESLEVKREVFGELDRICPSATILATNSSSIRVSRIEDATNRADRVLNIHFFMPVWQSPIVEIMGGSATSKETLRKAEQFARSIGMIPLMVQKESTGFIFNRVWRAIKRECLQVVDEGVATVEDVDRAWMVAMQHPIGPFGAMDRVGLDVVNDIEKVYYEESGEERDAPPQVLTTKIQNGHLGVKTGKGFYEYPDPAFEQPGFLTDGGKDVD